MPLRSEVMELKKRGLGQGPFSQITRGNTKGVPATVTSWRAGSPAPGGRPRRALSRRLFLTLESSSGALDGAPESSRHPAPRPERDGGVLFGRCWPIGWMLQMLGSV